jgi:hypothetical protein
MALKLSPETTAHVKLGSLAAGAASLVTATIFVWGIKTNGEQALAEIRDLRQEWKEEMVPCVRKVDRLWWMHDNGQSNPPTVTHNAIVPKVSAP